VSKQVQPGLGGPFEKIDGQCGYDDPGKARDLKNLDEFRDALRRFENNGQAALEPLNRAEAVLLLHEIADFIANITEEEAPINSTDSFILECKAKLRILQIANTLSNLDLGITDDLLRFEKIGTALMSSNDRNRKVVLSQSTRILILHERELSKNKGLSFVSGRAELAKILRKRGIKFKGETITATMLNNWWRNYGK